MKYLSLLIFAFLFTFNVLAQNKETSLSNAEQFSAQSGTLIEKTFIDVGKVKGLEIMVLKLKDLNSSKSLNALRFEYVYKSSYSSDTKVKSLDSDEIDGLVKTLKKLQEVFLTEREIYTEVSFKSRTGFEAGAFFDVDKKTWNAFIQVERFDKNSRLYLTPNDFEEILKLVELAQSKM